MGVGEFCVSGRVKTSTSEGLRRRPASLAQRYWEQPCP